MRVFPWLLVLVLAAFIFFMLQADLQVEDVEVPEVVEIDNGPNLIIEKVTDLGNLELVQYDFKDVVEYKVRKNKLLPDDQYLIVVAGEATACIDLRAITPTDIQSSVTGDTVYVQVPQPEICHTKLNHQKTKLYNNSKLPFGDSGPAIQEIYRLAEQKVDKIAADSDILDRARQNAQLVLKPLLEQTSGKTVFLQFGIPTTELNYN
jgi:hypothetical protein